MPNLAECHINNLHLYESVQKSGLWQELSCGIFVDYDEAFANIE